MAKVYPNLRRNNIESLELIFYLEGNVSAIKSYFKSKGYSGCIQEDQQIILFKNYTAGKSRTVFLMVIDFHEKDKNKARLKMEFQVDSQVDTGSKKIKPFKESDFLDFFKWFNGNEKITKGKVALLAHCLFPLTAMYQLPPQIEVDSKESMYPVGIRYGFQKKLNIDSVVVEVVDNKEKTLHFMIKTLPQFTFSIEYCNTKFFNSSIEFVNNMKELFCGKKGKRKKNELEEG